MGGEGGGASRKFRRAAKKIFVQTCGSFCQTQQPHLDTSSATTVSLSRSLSPFLKRPAGNFQFLILVPRLCFLSVDVQAAGIGAERIHHFSTKQSQLFVFVLIFILFYLFAGIVQQLCPFAGKSKKEPFFQEDDPRWKLNSQPLF